MKKYLLSIICTLLPIFASAQEPYAIFIDNGTALEFRYDNEKAARGGMDIGPFTSMDQVPWHENNQNIYSVIFDPSFANCTSITSTSLWFAFLSNLDYIGGIEYLNTSNVTDMYGMFWESWTITSLDLSSFNTGSVTDMGSMFAGCTALTTIYVSSGWSTSSVTSSNAMFEGCTSLMGESGTTYNSSHTDAEYARVDMASSPGYLTGGSGGGGSGEEGQYWMELQSTLQYANDVYSRSQGNANVEPWMQEELYYQIERGNEIYNHHEADEEEVRHMIEELNWICWEIEEAMNREPEPSGEAEPYAVLSNEGLVVTFYYDNQKDNRGGIDLNSSWIPNSPYETATTAVIDDSFASYSPTSTAYWFCGCRNITSISGIENINTENVTSMLGMFQGCSHLTEINVSGFNTSSVGEMGSMFEACSDLTTLDLSSFNTANVTGMSYMFANSMSLRTIYVSSSWSITSVTNSAGMFSECYSLVGGRGTEFSQDYTGVDYAHIDGGTSNPGYLTDINAEPSESEAYFDGLTAWVYGDATLDDAFEEVGRDEAAKTIAAIVWEANSALTSEQLGNILMNPNLLIYVNDASKAPSGWPNVIVNGVAEQIALTDVSAGNGNFHCPQAFTAKVIAYTRNFSQTTEIGVCRGWETIALPFTVQTFINLGHGNLVPFGGSNSGYPFWLHQLRDNGLTQAYTIEANTPYLICMPNNSVYPSAYNQAGDVSFVAVDATVPETHPHEAYSAGVTLIPAFQGRDSSPEIFNLNVGDARDNYAEGSVFISNYGSVRPFHAYALHTSQARGEDSRYIPLTSIGGGDGDTTGIMEIIQPAVNGTEAWYSLDGRRLNAKPTKKGVYVNNGRKVVIK